MRVEVRCSGVGAGEVGNKGGSEIGDKGGGEGDGAVEQCRGKYASQVIGE